MSESRSAFARFFGWIWRVLLGIYRVIVVLSVLATLFLVWTALRGGPAVTVEKNEPLTLIPTGALVEQSDNSSRGFVRELSSDRPSKTLLRDLTDALDAARMDARIPFVVLKLDDLQGAGLAQLQELAAAMKKFRASGKPIYAFGESFDQNQYYLAAQADEISLDPMGSVTLEGFSVYTNYFKDALDKLGVQINVFRVGEFKSAVEPFLRNDMSPDAKLANQAWLSDLWSTYNSGVDAARKLPENSADTYVRGFAAGLQQNQGDAAKLALASKLVTRIETQAEFRKRVADKVGYDKDKGSFRQIDSRSYLRAVKHDLH
ncbi:MAG: signal peptide peptidase SppA, partial [Nevskia sp.]|nr:signal peptide peptidase SppA [Nevskia sp.]